jgi:hypothetical protein
MVCTGTTLPLIWHRTSRYPSYPGGPQLKCQSPGRLRFIVVLSVTSGICWCRALNHATIFPLRRVYTVHFGWSLWIITRSEQCQHSIHQSDRSSKMKDEGKLACTFDESFWMSHRKWPTYTCHRMFLRSEQRVLLLFAVWLLLLLSLKFRVLFNPPTSLSFALFFNNFSTFTE